MARLMPLLLAAASAQELHGGSKLSNLHTPTLLLPPSLYLPAQTPPLQNNIYPPFNFLSYQLSHFPNLQQFFFSPSLQVKHVLAGSEYSAAAAAGREEKALIFGDQLDEKKFTSCKPRGNDPRSLNDFTTEDIEKMNNVSFSDPEYTNRVLLVVNLASF